MMMDNNWKHLPKRQTINKSIWNDLYETNSSIDYDDKPKMKIHKVMFVILLTDRFLSWIALSAALFILLSEGQGVAVQNKNYNTTRREVISSERHCACNSIFNTHSLYISLFNQL